MSVPPPTLSRRVSTALAVGPAMIFIVLLIAQPLRFAPAMWAAFYMDDFYYYVVIAQNFVGHGLPSFDGVTATNGYHPLYMLLISALLVMSSGAGRAFFLALILVKLLAYLAAIWQVAAVMARARAPACLTVGVTLIFAVAFACVALTGMEVILAVPIILAFLTQAERVGKTGEIRPFCFGLLASACILARVDAALLVVLAAVAILPSLRPLLRRRRDLAALALGLAPAGLYFCVNVAVFGALLPLSSAAKALAPPFFFNAEPLARALLGFGDPVIACVIIVPAWCILACAIAGLAAWRTSGQPARLRTAICGFPALFYLMLAVHSDWMLWEWYLYPIVVALPFAGLTMGEALFRWNAKAAAPTVVAAGVLLGLLPAMADVAAHYAHQQPGSNAMFTQAVALRPFMASHPGTYAMGDQAGTAAFLSGARVFQLEGLVEDRALLTDIANRAPLLGVLRKRHVDYYIGTAMLPDGGCWIGVEPKRRQAGPLSPAMTGRFCSAPVFRTTGAENGQTLIFSVAAESKQAVLF